MLPRPTLARRAGSAPVLLTAALALLAGFGAGCSGTRTTADGAGSAAGGGWSDLTDPSHWRSYSAETFPSGWALQDGAITRLYTGDGGDIVSRETYGDFEFEMEWKLSACGNSGFFYRGVGGAEAIYNTSPEYQLLDDTCHDDAAYPSHRAGSVYDLYTPTSEVALPGGQWNRTRVVARGAHVEHWLNGVKVAEYEQGSPDWNARVQASKFRDEPGFGTYREGMLGLQDHGDRVWFRTILIRRLG